MDVGKFSMSELLANYADKVLHKGGIKGERKLIEEQLDNLALLFTYLYEKDLFLQWAKTYVTRKAQGMTLSQDLR